MYATMGIYRATFMPQRTHGGPQQKDEVKP